MSSPRQSQPDDVPSVSDDARPAPAGKGRPTPKRKEAAAANQRPLVPADRKAAKRAGREAAKAQRDREYQAMQTGDERYLPARDKGPVRRWVRDYVDARRSPGEYFLPVSIGLVMATILFAQNAIASLVILVVLYLIIFAVVIDAWLLSRRINKKLIAKFGAGAVPRGTLMYGTMRSFQMRRSRLPKPQVERGHWPA